MAASVVAVITAVVGGRIGRLQQVDERILEEPKPEQERAHQRQDATP